MLLAIGDRPFGAMPDDTGEYMLGDVRVSVVLMESDEAMAQQRGFPTTTENWTAEAIEAVKDKVRQGLAWWESTLDALLASTPAAGRDLLNFSIDFTHADTPVKTAYEPISRTSDFLYIPPVPLFNQPEAGWGVDFLNFVGFNAPGTDFFTDIRAWNDFQRRQGPGYDWAFTIFVVNDANDDDKKFAEGGAFRQAFAYAGGLLMVVPASRPPSTFAHEAGHMFWAFDEYLPEDANGNPIPGTTNYLKRRGYYNTQNTNSADNSAEGFVQQPSIMSNDRPYNNNSLSTSYATQTLAEPTREMVGWKDSDGDGLFDVLDVPFTLAGSGYYDPLLGVYRFVGSTSVATFPNQNSYTGSFGLQNDITVNQIRAVQYKIDDGSWQTYPLTIPPRTYKLNNVDLSIDLSQLSPGSHTIRIRAIDTRTGAMSPEFIGNTTTPSLAANAAISGFVFNDEDADGVWDAGETAFPDFGLNILDQNSQPVDLRRIVEPDGYEEGTPFRGVPDLPGVTATLTPIGTNFRQGADVVARASTLAPAAGNVFGTFDAALRPLETWTHNDRKLKIEFSSPVGVVSVRAFRGTGGSISYARMEAFDSQGRLLERVTSGSIPASGFTLSISRAVGDIAFVVVGGHAHTNVVLDTLQWGPNASATTNALGAYSLAGYPAGVYRLQAVAPAGYIVTSPAGGIATVSVSAGQSSQINFAIARSSGEPPPPPPNQNLWHNYANPFNVDGDLANNITPLDLLLIFNWLNANPQSINVKLPAAGPPSSGMFLDVNNDEYCTALDALLVVNYLNDRARSGSGEAEAGPWSGPGTDSPSGEGEEPLPVPRTAAEYFAQWPTFITPPAGSIVPCTCASCFAARAATPARSAAEGRLTRARSVGEGLTLTPGASEGLFEFRERATAGLLPASSASGQPLPWHREGSSHSASYPLVLLSPLDSANGADRSSLRSAHRPALDETLDLLAEDVAGAFDASV